MTVLVTGGAGYIGSHTCKELAKAGFLPVTYDNLSTGHANAVKWGPLVVGDILDKELLRQTFQIYRPIAVLHFAANALVIESVQNPAKYYRNNVVGTLTLLEVMCEENVKRLIFSSTCATYGEPQVTPMTEDHPQMPTSPYGRTKLIAEQMMSDFEVFGLKTIKLRYFNAAGADLLTEIGENHTPETHIIPLVIQTAMKQRPNVTIYGSNFPTRDGSAIRDFIHVDDLAKAHVLSLKYLLEKNQSDAFNLGTGVGTSVLEIIEAVQKRSEHQIPVQRAERRMGEPAILTADNRKIEQTLGWTPSLKLDEIIDSAWRWHQRL